MDPTAEGDTPDSARWQPRPLIVLSLAPFTTALPAQAAHGRKLPPSPAVQALLPVVPKSETTVSKSPLPLQHPA